MLVTFLFQFKVIARTIADIAQLGKEEDGAGKTQDICASTVVRAVESAVCSFHCYCFENFK